MGLCANAMTANKSCTNSDECPNNKINSLVVKDENGKVLETFKVNNVSPMVMPPVVLSSPEKKKEKTSKVVVQQRKETGMPMPPCVLN